MSGEMRTLVPYCIVYVNGTRIAVEQEASLKQITVIDRLDGPATCRIVLSDTDRAWTDSEEFTEGQQVSVHLGYKDDIDEVFNGDIVGMQAQYSRTADDTVVIVCHNALHRLRRAQRNVSYSEMSDSDIIAEIASANGLSCSCDDMGDVRDFVVQKEMSDYDFIMQLAGRHGYAVWARDGEICVKAEPPETEDLIVEWEKSLIEFDVYMSTADLVSTVEVRGWDESSGEAVVGSAGTGDISRIIGSGDLGNDLMEAAFGEAKLLLSDYRVYDQVTAEAIAVEKLTDNSLGYVKGNGRCEGDYRINAGATLEVKEIGGRFSGAYLVREVKHIFSASSGYSTRFSVVRNTV